MTERDDRLPAGNHRHQQHGPDQGTEAFNATNPAYVPRHAIIDRRHDRTHVRMGSLSQ
jgi:hypothetical protein